MRVPTRLEAVRWLADEAQLTFVDGYPSTFVIQLLRLLAECPAHLPPSQAPLGPWIASRRADSLVLGAVSCAVVGEGPEGSLDGMGGPVGGLDGSAVTVGYEVAPTCEGQGYATEMLGLVCAHLLGQPDIVRICADTEVGHAASRRVMEKAGLSWRRDEVEARGGRTTTVAHYAVDRGPPR
jgi:RimJ/RimL family protein N-acetyltransferase